MIEPPLKIPIDPPLSRLRIGPTCTITFTDPLPHWWFRFWTRVLLGWKWEEV